MNAQLIEHIACYAAEHGHTELEDLCDSVLAGDTSEDLVLAVLADARGPDVTEFDDLPTYVDHKPWQSRTEPARGRAPTRPVKYVPLEAESDAWYAEFLERRGA
jgi:hypothetical protein